MLAFLEVNRYVLDQSDDEIATMIESLAAGVVDQSRLFEWTVAHVKPREQ